MNLLKLVRPINLILIALMQSFVHFGLFYEVSKKVALDALHFFLLTIATLCIAAAGNIINDVYDVAIDTVNKPNKVLIGEKITEKNAIRWYIVLSSVGVGIGFYLSNNVGSAGFAAIFIIISALLYLYTSYFKGILLLGNLIISLLVATSIVIVGLFDLLPNIGLENRNSFVALFKLLLTYALFGFLLNLIREIVKDIQDVNGDKIGGMNTLPIAIGRKRAASVVFWMAVIITFIIIGYVYQYLYQDRLLLLYFMFLIVAPLVYFCIRSRQAERIKDFIYLSHLLKLIMFLGMCSMLLYI